MSATYLFGFAHEDLESASAAVQDALGVRLESRDSMYVGVYYQATLASGESLELRRNLDPLFDEAADPPEERLAETEFPSARLLLYIHGAVSESLRQTLKRITGISLLSERDIA